MLGSASHGAASVPRQALRQSLSARRDAFVGGTGFEDARRSLARLLLDLLSELEPESLGLYWAHRSEFNAVDAVVADPPFTESALSLPFARRSPVEMHYRSWNRRPPVAVDECGIATGDGAVVVPEVVLVPCVGFTPTLYRLGYGGGYFDRWLALHPGTVAVGVAWSAGAMEAAEFTPEPHDLPLTLIVTEHGVI